MSRRYGRNQKRRAREALAAAELRASSEASARMRQEGVTRDYQAKSSYLLQCINELAEALPRGFYGLPPVEDTTDLLPDDGVPLRRDVMPPMLSFMPLTDEAMPDTVEYRVNELLTFIGTLHFDQLADKVHFLMKFTDGCLYYSASRQAIQSMPRERLHRLIAGNLAEQFAKARPIKNGGR